MSFGFNTKELETIYSIFEKYSDLKEVIIFGSRAIGNYKPGSDVDLALKTDKNPDLVDRISRELNEESPLPYKFDVVDYNTVSKEEFLEHIRKFGKLFWSENN